MECVEQLTHRVLIQLNAITDDGGAVWNLVEYAGIEEPRDRQSDVLPRHRAGWHSPESLH